MSCTLFNSFPVGSGRCQVFKQDPTRPPSFTSHFPGALSRGGWRAKMIGPVRPKFVIFGSSIVEYCFRDNGWGAQITDLYSRQADVMLRGYAGWTSAQAIKVVEEIFPKDSIIQPSLVIVYFGGNDAMSITMDNNTLVPLPDVITNMTKIASHIKSLSTTTRSIFLTPPPSNMPPEFEKIRSMENLEKFADALIDICKEIGVEYLDLFRIIQTKDNWQNFFKDGIHFNEEGSKVVFAEIRNAINRANWQPPLVAELMPVEYSNIPSPFAFGRADFLTN